MARVFVYSLAAAALVANSSPLVEAIGQWPPAIVAVTPADVTRLETSMVNATLYASDMPMRVCYTEIANLRFYDYGHTFFYRLNACEVPTVVAPKCSTTQLASCTPAFYTFGVRDSSGDVAIVNVRKDVDQGPTGLGDWVQGGSGSGYEDSSAAAATPSATTATPTSAAPGNSSNNTEAGAVTAPTSAVPATTPKQSAAVPVGVSLASVVGSLAVAFASL